MSHSPTRIAAAALLGATATACLVALRSPAEAAPLAKPGGHHYLPHVAKD